MLSTWFKQLTHHPEAHRRLYKKKLLKPVYRGLRSSITSPASRWLRACHQLGSHTETCGNKVKITSTTKAVNRKGAMPDHATLQRNTRQQRGNVQAQTSWWSNQTNAQVDHSNYREMRGINAPVSWQWDRAQESTSPGPRWFPGTCPQSATTH